VTTTALYPPQPVSLLQNHQTQPVSLLQNNPPQPVSSQAESSCSKENVEPEHSAELNIKQEESTEKESLVQHFPNLEQLNSLSEDDMLLLLSSIEASNSNVEVPTVAEKSSVTERNYPASMLTSSMLTAASRDSKR